MLNMIVPFDTLAYVTELKKGGFSDQQAEAQLKAQIEAMSFMINTHLATKENVREVREELRETKEEFREEFRKVKEEIRNVGEKLTTITTALEHQIKTTSLKTQIFLGSMVILAVPIIITILNFLLKN